MDIFLYVTDGLDDYAFFFTHKLVISFCFLYNLIIYIKSDDIE